MTAPHDDGTRIDWSRLVRLGRVERERYFRLALEEIDEALATSPRDKRLTAVETILAHLGTEENLRI